MADSIQQSFGLCEALGRAPLANGETLADALRLGTDVSLWEAVAPYVTLYGFPQLFGGARLASRNGRAEWLSSLRSRVRWRRKHECSAWEDKPNVLVLGFSPTHYRDVLRPVVDRLLREPGLSSVVMTAGGPHGNGGHLGATCESIWNHWDRAAEDMAAVLDRRLRTVEQKIMHPGILDAIVRELAISVDPDALRRECKWLFVRLLRPLVEYLVVVDHILRHHRPALLVYADDTDQRLRVFSLAAQSCGVPTLLVQQGFSTDGAYPEWRHFSATAVAAMGETSRQAMLAQGVSASHIHVTGHAGFDQLFTNDVEEIARVRRALRIEPHDRMALFACQPAYPGAFRTTEIRREMIEALAHAAAKVTGLRLVIKPHPGDDERELRRLFGRHPSFVMLERSVEITPLIKACDVLVTFFSQSALQALCAGKTVINIAFPDSGEPTLYIASGATRIARSTDEIIRHLREVVHSTGGVGAPDDALAEVRRRFVKKWAFVPDGRASDRVATLAIRLMQSSENALRTRAV